MQVIRKRFVVRAETLRYGQSDRKIARVVMAEILHFVQNDYTKNVIAVNAETLHFVQSDPTKMFSCWNGNALLRSE